MNSIEAEDDPDYEKNEMKVISQVGALSYVYDFDENSDYYVTYANTMIKDEEYTVQDWAFAFNDLRVHKRKSLPKIKEGLHYYLFLLLYFVVFFFWLRQYLGRVSYYYSPQAIYHTYLFLVSYKILDHYSH